LAYHGLSTQSSGIPVPVDAQQRSTSAHVTTTAELSNWLYHSVTETTRNYQWDKITCRFG